MTEQEEWDLATHDAHMRRVADKWRARLADPQIKAQLANGTMELSPMVTALLRAYPPTPQG